VSSLQEGLCARKGREEFFVLLNIQSFLVNHPRPLGMEDIDEEEQGCEERCATPSARHPQRCLSFGIF
jgi:hypothetical protein